jgi:HEAT repeat protein
MNHVRLATVLFALLALSLIGRGTALPLLASPADVAALTAKLKDPSEETRRVAVADLAQLKTPAAWALVVDALADPSPLVADEAQVRLGDIEDSASLKAVFGKSGTGAKDPLVQRRAIEAIGRMKVEIDGIALSKLLANRDLEVRRTTAHALELLAAENRLEKKSRGFAQQQLDQVLKGEKDPFGRAAALPARHALAPYTVSDLFSMLSKRGDGVVRSSVSYTLGEVDFGMVIDLVNDTLEEEEPCAVRVLVELFRISGTKSAAESLAVIMKRYPNLRISWLIVDTLRQWSGLPHGLDSSAWDTWASGLPGGWTAPDNPPGERKHPTKTSLLGQPVISDRIAILVDTSEWIMAKRADGTVNKAWLKGEMGKTLASMPEKSEFNIIPYGAAPALCEKALVAVKQDTTRHALKVFEESALPGKDNFLDAAWLALADPRVDTLIVVTDSAPAGSQHVDQDLIAEEFEQRNRFLRVVLDVVLVGGDADVAEKWQRLAAPTGGRVTKASQ